VSPHAPALFDLARSPRSPLHRWRRRARCLLLAAPLLGACAFNDHGLVRVHRYENDSAVLLHLTAIGAHLVTYAGDAGLTLGYSDRTYVFPRTDGPVHVPMSAVADPDAWQRTGRLHAVDANPARSDEPVMRVARTGGLSLDANRNRVGLALGVAYRAALWLPVDGSRVVRIHYAPGDDAGVQVIIHQEAK
jgi:hypothetical protein